MSLAPLTVWTIGHSTRPIDEFLDLLRTPQIELVADVRRHAGSRKYPQFNPESLAASLAMTVASLGCALPSEARDTAA